MIMTQKTTAEPECFEWICKLVLAQPLARVALLAIQKIVRSLLYIEDHQATSMKASYNVFVLHCNF